MGCLIDSFDLPKPTQNDSFFLYMSLPAPNSGSPNRIYCHIINKVVLVIAGRTEDVSNTQNQDS
jgi:hypothetical protein